MNNNYGLIYTNPDLRILKMEVDNMRHTVNTIEGNLEYRIKKIEEKLDKKVDKYSDDDNTEKLLNIISALTRRISILEAQLGLYK
jgi:predicted house-cleaning noncanonical NTP pyrophosphatase (MazG superfamily)